jgi:hypothetical protein|tara:strand:- start:1261 stop:2160 length:900 start_codon:yes stop_codon:yes gene_type:complete
MAEKGRDQGNPGTESEVQNAVLGSSDFFNQLDDSVNGMVNDGQAQAEAEVTPSESGSRQATHIESQSGSNNADWDTDNNPYKKRYKDSSRESVKLNEELRTLRPFVPVLEAMKKDSGLVNHVRDYLKSGGAPAKSVTERLNLNEDFEFDGTDAVKDPDSDSARVLNAHVDGLVQQRVGTMLAGEKAKSQAMQKNFIKKKQEMEFKKTRGMSDDEYGEMVKQAKDYKLTLDDVHYLLNRDKTAANVAQSTKKDMLNQMKNVRDIPTSVSDSNNQGQTRDANATVFDDILSLDDDVDNLFG